MPNQLFKFSSPTPYALQNLEKGEICCQHYSAYNDPFEFWSYVYEGIPDAKKEPRRFLEAKRAWGCEWKSPDDEDLIAYFDECKDYQPPFKGLRDSMRIACFGSQHDDLLMWSHYADGLRGFCIVFDEDLITCSDRSILAIDVTYRETPPVADAFVYGIAKDQIWFHEMAIDEAEARTEHLGQIEPFIVDYQQALFEACSLADDILQVIFATKPHAWRYEKERRLLVQTQQKDTFPFFLPYPPEAVKEVILGELMPREYRSKILSTLKRCYPSVPAKTARRVHSDYRLIID